VRNLERKSAVERLRCRWDDNIDNIKMGFKEMG
jgi:hypothetical protein